MPIPVTPIFDALNSKSHNYCARILGGICKTTLIGNIQTTRVRVELVSWFFALALLQLTKQKDEVDGKLGLERA